MRDDVVEIHPHGRQLAEARMHEDGIVVVHGAEEIEAELEDGIHVAVSLDLPQRKARVAQQAGPPELEEAKVVGVVNRTGAIRVGEKHPVRYPVPDEPPDGVAHVALVVLVRRRLELWCAHSARPRGERCSSWCRRNRTSWRARIRAREGGSRRTKSAPSELGIGQVIQRRQHPLAFERHEREHRLDRRGGAERVADLALVGGDGHGRQAVAEYLAQAAHLDGVAGGRRGAVRIHAADGAGVDLGVGERFPHGAHDGGLVGAGEVVSVRGPADARDLGGGLEAVRRDRVLCGQHHGGGALGQHEATPVDAERSRGGARVGGGPIRAAQLEAGVHVGEAEDDLGDERHLHAAGHGEIDVAVAHHARAEPDGVVARGAGALRARRWGR